MRKIIGISSISAFFIFMLWVFSYALDNNVWLSSNTRSADATKNLCAGTNFVVGTSTITVGGRGVLHGVCINSGVTASSITIYNSSGTSTLPIASIATSTPMPCSFYDVMVSSGLTYTSPGGSSDITILYNCF